MTPSHPHSAFAKPPPDPQTQTLAACAIALNCLATLRHALDAFQSHASQTQQPRLQHLACAATAVLDDSPASCKALAATRFPISRTAACQPQTPCCADARRPFMGAKDEYSLC